MAAHQAPLSLGFSRQEHWSGLPFPSPMHESEKWKWRCSVLSDSVQPHRWQPIRLLHPWDFPGKSTGVGCHCLLLRKPRERQNHHCQKIGSLWLSFPGPSTVLPAQPVSRVIEFLCSNYSRHFTGQDCSRFWYLVSSYGRWEQASYA